MPIVVIDPLGGVISPGQNILLDSDFIGPIPADSFWNISIVTTPDEHIARFFRAPCTTPIQDVDLSLNALVPDRQRFPLVNGQQIAVDVSIEGPSGIIDSGTTAGLTWQNEASITQLLQELQGTTTAGSFTTEDRATLGESLAAVQVPFPISTAIGAVANTALGSIVQQAPIGLLTKQECQNLVGDGVLTRPVGAFNVNALGLTWQFLVVPEFAGKQLGAAIEYEQRVLQLKVVAHDFNGVDAVLQVVDAHSDQQFLTWGLAPIDRIEYSVAPGCTVQVCWLLLL